METKEFATEARGQELVRQVALLTALHERGVKLPNPISSEQLNEIFEQAIGFGVAVPYKPLKKLSNKERMKFFRTLEGFNPSVVETRVIKSNAEYRMPVPDYIYFSDEDLLNTVHRGSQTMDVNGWTPLQAWEHRENLKRQKKIR